MRALTLGEMSFVSGGNAEGPGVEYGPGGVVMRRSFDGAVPRITGTDEMVGGVNVITITANLSSFGGGDSGVLYDDDHWDTPLGAFRTLGEYNAAAREHNMYVVGAGVLAGAISGGNAGVLGGPGGVLAGVFLGGAVAGVATATGGVIGGGIMPIIR
jgi:hypothetical protein